MNEFCAKSRKLKLKKVLNARILKYYSVLGDEPIMTDKRVLKTNWKAVRSDIKEEEQLIKEKFGLSVRVYGSGGQGYGLLGGCLNRNMYRPEVVYSDEDRIDARKIWHGEGRRTRLLRRQVHEYWTFLIILERLSDEEQSADEEILYQPTERAHNQFPAFRTHKGSLFVEPRLIQFKRDYTPKKFEKQFEQVEASGSLNATPSFLLTDPTVKKISWGKRSWNIEDTPNENANEKRWNDFSGSVRHIIECRDKDPSEEDLSQSLYRSFAYKSPILLIVQGQFNENLRKKFKENVSKLDSEVKIVENFKIGSRDKCKDLLSFL